MFSGCSSLSSLPDISKWKTNNVNNMNGMFSGCSSLSSLPDISKWNTNNVNNMSTMFFQCSSLTSLPDISKWTWIYGTVGRSNGFFLQITSQGYCYFGFFFAPVFACFFMWLSARIEEWIAKTENLFVYFFLSYVFIRTSTCVLGGTMSGYITNVTMTLLVCGAFLLLQRFFGSILKKR